MDSIPRGTYKAIDVRHGDCREVIKTLADNSIDACVTDPPYSLQTINKRFAKVGRNDKTWSSSGPHQRTARGFMNQSWDTGEVAHDPEFWAEVYRVLKPGAHLAAFGGTRTYHRMVCAIEDAGFEIRDQIGWAYATGFPKSHDVSKGIDRAAGVERDQVAPRSNIGHQRNIGNRRPWMDDPDHKTDSDEPATPAPQEWQGWGTALKPAWEPIVLARKPLEGTVAENVLKWGTGAINVNGCRIDAEGRPLRVLDAKETAANVYSGRVAGDASFSGGSKAIGSTDLGRWPANICHDGSDEVVALFPESGGQQGDLNETGRARPTKTCFGDMPPPRAHKARRGGEASAERRYTEEGSTNFAAMPGERRSDAGSAARFFFSAKADKDDRFGSKHPTVKPIDLIRWLIRLVTPPGTDRVVLDPFAGSGTAGVAAMAEGVGAILVEREPAYHADIIARMAFYEGEGRHSVAAKARSSVPRGTLPLFEEPTMKGEST